MKPVVNYPSAFAGFAATLLFHTFIFWVASHILASVEVLSMPVPWVKCGFLAFAYITSKMWMHLVTSNP